MVLYVQFCSRKKLTYSAIGELLQLLHVICPPSQLPKIKFFDSFSQEHVNQKVCLQCKQVECSCAEVAPNSSARLVKLDVKKSLKAIITSKYDYTNTNHCIPCLNKDR